MKNVYGIDMGMKKNMSKAKTLKNKTPKGKAPMTIAIELTPKKGTKKIKNKYF